MEVKVQKTKDGIALAGSLPSELANASSVEIFPLRDGAYLLALPGLLGKAQAAPAAANAPSSGGKLNEAERQLVKKLAAIRFDRRTPGEVERALVPKEREVLSGLVKKKLVWVYRSEKYGEGVYNVSDEAYGEARDAQPSGAAPQPARDPLARGWLVLDSEGEAKYLSNTLADRIKAGEVSGLRAFDRKYYFIRKDFAAVWQPKMQSSLEKGNKTAEELARELGLEIEGCRALLLHMSEAGELLEKGKGKFALA